MDPQKCLSGSYQWRELWGFHKLKAATGDVWCCPVKATGKTDYVWAVWGNLANMMTTFRPFTARWSGIRIVKGSSWSWTQTWWAWWPWWAIVFFLEAAIFNLFNTLPMGLMRSELQFSWIFKKVTEWHRPMRESLQTWNVSMWFRLPNVILSVSNGAFVATVAAEQFRYRCLHLVGSSHSQVDIRGWLIYIPSKK